MTNNASSQRTLGQRLGRPPCVGSHLHDAIPVVTSGDSEEGQKGHTKVPKGGMPAQALTGVCLITLWEQRVKERSHFSPRIPPCSPALTPPPSPISTHPGLQRAPRPELQR